MTTQPEAAYKDFQNRVDAEIARANTTALDTWRAWANQADIHTARRALPEAIDRWTEALADKRAADANARTAKEAFDTAAGEAAWILEDCFEKKGNSWQLVQLLQGQAIVPLDEPRPMTADAKADWLKQAAGHNPAVVAAANDSHRAEELAAQAGDNVKVTEVRLQAARYELQAATAVLETIAKAAPKGA